MVEAALRTITVSAEILAAAKVIPRLVHNDVDAKVLSSALAASLSASDSDRGFAGVARNGDVVREVLFANTKLVESDASELPVLTALRSYLVRHLTGTRCEDTIEDGTPGAEKEGPYALQIFNSSVASREDIRPITQDETRGSKTEGRASSSDYANQKEIDGIEGRIKDALTRRRMTATRTPAPEWSHQVRQLLSEIQDLSGAVGQDRLELFRQRMRSLLKLTDSTLSSDMELAVAGAVTVTLEDPPLIKNSPAAWLTELGGFLLYQQMLPEMRGLMKRAMDTMAQRAGLPPGPEGPVLPARTIPERLAGSQISVVSLYGRILLLDINPR